MPKQPNEATLHSRHAFETLHSGPNMNDTEKRTEDMSIDNPAMLRPAIYNTSAASTLAEPAAEAQPHRYDMGWRRIVRNFSPSWFATTMGTGIVSVLLVSIPYPSRWLFYLSIVFFALNACLFLAALVVSALRYMLYPAIWGVMIRDARNSLFLGTVPMGFATLVEMWIFVCVPAWGPWAVTVAWVAWMIDAVVSVCVTVFLAFML